MDSSDNSDFSLVYFVLGVVAIIFVVVTLTYVAMKQLEHSIKSQPTCFPPYILMEYGPARKGLTTPVTRCEDGLRPHTVQRTVNRSPINDGVVDE